MNTFDNGKMVHHFCHRCKHYSPIHVGYSGWIVLCMDCFEGNLFIEGSKKKKGVL